MRKITKFGNNKKIEVSRITKADLESMGVGDILQLKIDENALGKLVCDSDREYVYQGNRVFRKK